MLSVPEAKQAVYIREYVEKQLYQFILYRLSYEKVNEDFVKNMLFEIVEKPTECFYGLSSPYEKSETD